MSSKLILQSTRNTTTTTDNQQEMFDVISEQDEVIGTTTRAQAHKDNSIIHRSICVLVFNDKNELLMQKRSMTKDTSPGEWALSVGGHVQSGQSYEDTVQRELQEELGNGMPSIFWKKSFVRTQYETELNAMYLAWDNGPFPNFNTVEADEVRFFALADLVGDSRVQTLTLSPPSAAELPGIAELVNSPRFIELHQQWLQLKG